ncbi:GUN4 domain-containing protein, partial [Leptolyngbya sp. FACHB-36]|uniref:GUN4 domain-containing protein n=1 Tax=Leptolyngbya sp. FACHB-36 TaxID=2692808 RepID=UPI0016806AA7
MKRIITLGFLAFLAAGSAAQPLLFLTQSRSGEAAAAIPTASPTASSAAMQSRDIFYMSDRFGFRIVSPKGYVITPSETTQAPQPAVPVQALEVWQQADFLNRANLPETPPIISITVYNNPKRLPLTYWKGELSRSDDRPLTVAGQAAIAYTSTGLYEYNNVLLSSPDGHYVFRLKVGYLNPKDAIGQTFQQIVSSFTFDVLPSSNSSKWRINYSHLQRLLTARNWQAADSETRAILQRLAGPQGDLLFSSKSVLNRIPSDDLRTLDTLWSTASNGRFGFSAQQRVWQQVASSKNPKARVERFAQMVGWRRNQPLPNNNPVGMELGGTLWRLDTELNYTMNAPVGHFPWIGVSSHRLIDLLNER